MRLRAVFNFSYYRNENSQDRLYSILAVNQIAPRGFEPLLENNQSIDNKELTENTNSRLCASLCETLQKHPELEAIIKAWPELPEHTKQAIKALIETSKQKD